MRSGLVITPTWRYDLTEMIRPRNLLIGYRRPMSADGIILSHIEAFHDPTPDKIPMAVVGSQQAIQPTKLRQRNR